VALAAVVGLLAAAVAAPGQAAGQEAGEVRTYPLDRAVAIDLRNNRELRVAEFDLATAEKQVGEAYGGLLPEIDGSASYQRNLLVPETFLPAAIFDPNASPDDLIPVRFGADNQWQASIEARQPLFDAAVFIGVSTAGKFREFSREALRGAAQQTATNVRIAYLNVLLAEERVRLTGNSVERVTQTLEEARAMNRVGLLGDYDVLRLEVELANIEPELRRSRDQLSAARRTLAIEMGLPDSEPVGAEGNLAEVDPSDAAANSEANRLLLTFNGVEDPGSYEARALIDRAARSRSDVLQLTLRRDLEEVRVKVERTELMPTMNAFFNYGVSAQENGALNFFGQDATQRTQSAAVGLRVTVPIFSGFRRWNRVAQREIAVRQVESQLADLRVRAENDIEVRSDEVTEARARASAQERAIGEARRGFDIASLQYREGTGSRLEVTDSEVALRQSELNYAQAIYDYLVARARLDLAVGEVPAVDAALGQMVARPGAERSAEDLK
jgi:outer membrane protein TolC